MKINRKQRFGLVNFIATLLIVVGVGMLGVYIYYHYTGIEIVKLPKAEPENPSVNEKDVTEEQKTEHTVPAKDPRYLSVSRLGIKNARIINVGLINGNQIDSPVSIFDVGWFNGSARQGDSGQQSIMLNGHNGGPTRDGVFKHLPDLTNGDLMVIERGDGQISTYRVAEKYELKLGDVTDEEMQKANRTVDSQETITIISCSGRWIPAQQTYDHRTFVRAVLTDNLE